MIGNEPLVSVDLHGHLLPGIDDGAKLPEDTLRLAEALLERGIPKAAATSHIYADLYPNERPGILQALEGARGLLKEAGLPLELLAGSEVRLDAESCRASTWLTYGDANKYLLVELPPGVPLQGAIESLLFSIQAAGVTPIIAHPERQAILQKKPELLGEWVAKGMLAQGTLSVLAGNAAPQTREVLEGFLRKGWIHVVATDAHAVDRRLRDMDKAVVALERVVGEAAARAIRFDNATAVALGRAVAPVPVAAKASAKRWWMAWVRK